MKSKRCLLTANFTGVTRHDTMEGDDYLVAPMVMIVEGVLNGDGGALLYPSEELSKTPQMWNHKPVIVYHPQSGSPTACDPDILTNRKIGVIMNTKFEDGKLLAEAWMKEDRINLVDNRIAEAIENQEMLELSTGVFVDTETKSGEFKGVKYDAIARNHRPDHLAILPDLKGASSIEDGAGFLRLNEMGFGAIRSLLSGLLYEKNDAAWIEEVYETFFIFETGGQLFKQNYTIPKEGEVSFSDEPMEVVRVIEYRTTTGEFVANAKSEHWLSANINVSQENIEMDKKEIIDGLIANKFTSWTEEDRVKLNKFDKESLTKMQPVANEDDTQAAAEEGAGETGTKKPADAPADKPADASAEKPADAPVENQEQTVEEFIANAPPKIQAVLNSGIAAHDAEKKQRIDRIMENAANPYSKEELELKDLMEIRQLSVFAVNTETEEQKKEPLKINNYSGQAPVSQNTTKMEPIPETKMTFEKRA